MDQRKDAVRQAANIRVDSRSSFVDISLDILRLPLLRDMQNTRQCILSPLKKGGLPANRIPLMQMWLIIYVFHYNFQTCRPAPPGRVIVFIAFLSYIRQDVK
jgi:hypothetical protein